jgi:hypothetical protein
MVSVLVNTVALLNARASPLLMYRPKALQHGENGTPLSLAVCTMAVGYPFVSYTYSIRPGCLNLPPETKPD